MVLVGIDWSEGWHDVCLMDDGGLVLGRRRIDDSPAGLTQLQSLGEKNEVFDSRLGQGIVDRDVLPVRSQGALALQLGLPRTDGVEDEVVEVSTGREVLSRVFDDHAGPERLDQIQFGGAAHCGDIRSEASCELNGGGADRAGGSIDEHPLSPLKIRLLRKVHASRPP